MASPAPLAAVEERPAKAIGSAASGAGFGGKGAVLSDPDVPIERRLRALRETLAVLRREAHDLRPRAERARRAAQLLGPPAASASGGTVAHPLRDHIGDLEKELDGLRTAMRTRAVIEQAKGVVMQREHCDADAAFEVLKRASQRAHTKLHEVAQRTVVAAAAMQAARR